MRDDVDADDEPGGGVGTDDTVQGDGDPTDDPADESEASDEWRFSLSDLDDGEEAAAEDDGGEGIAGEFVPDSEIEPGTPSRRNALWVVVGAVLAVIGLPAMFLPIGFQPTLVAVSVAVTLVIAVGFLALFGLLTPGT